MLTFLDAVAIHGFCSFLSDYDLFSVDLAFGDLIQFTYERVDGLARSWADHVAYNNPFVPSISDVHRVSFGTNLLDHFPVSFAVDFASVSSPTPVCSYFSSSLSFDWPNASQSQLEKFRLSVAPTLPCLLSEMVSCCSSSCASHVNVIDRCCEQFLCCLQNSAFAHLPCRSHRPRSNLAGWNDGARHLKTDSNFWYKVWVEVGCLTYGVLFEIKKNAV